MSKATGKFVEFLGQRCEIVKHQYTNTGRVALELVIAEGDEEGEPMATATVNMPEVSLRPDEVIIKDYSENAGMLDVLLKAGIVERSGRTVQHGFCESEICILCI